MTYKVSLIVAVYNIEKLISRCVESLINQTLDDIEIILINDKSTDSSGEICNEYSEKYDNIFVINHEKNKGLSEARNTGIEKARGEYIMFVDGDDYLLETAVEKVYNMIKIKDSDVLIFGAFLENINGKRTIMPIDDSKSIYENRDVMTKLFPKVIGSLPEHGGDYDVGFAPWGRICKLQFIREKKIRFISERQLIYEDLMFALDLYPEVGKASVLAEPLYVYCENGNSLTRTGNQERYFRVKTMYNYIINSEKYRKLFEQDDIMIRFQRTIISYIRLCVMQNANKLSDVSYIKKIIKDDMCCQVVKNYPYYKLPIRQGIFCFFLRYRCAFALFLLVNLYRLIK